MRVKLANIKPNRYRDMAVDPVDAERVTILAQSIHDHTFWGGTPCRKLPSGEIENAAGWHRILAAQKAGVEYADLVVSNFTDDQMIGIYAIENATQRGNTPLTIAGSVAGALRKCLEEDLTGEITSQDGKWGGRRHGVGRDQVLAKLKGVPGIGPNVVKQQLANLKDSGHYDRIEGEVAAKVEAEHAAELARVAAEEEAARKAEEAAAAAEARRREAEEQRRKAAEERQRAAEEARLAREAKAREAAQQREAAAEERRKAAAVREAAAAAEAESRRKAAEVERNRAAVSAARKPVIAAAVAKVTAIKNKPRALPTFDMTGVGKYFKVPSHLEAFRIIITSEGIAHGKDGFLPVEKQAEVAAAMIELYNKKKDSGELKHMHPPELTAQLIRELTKEVLASDRMLTHLASEAEKRRAREELARSKWLDQWNAACYDLSRQAKAVLTTVQKLEQLGVKRPSGTEVTQSVSFSSAQSQLHTAVRIIDKFTTPPTLELVVENSGN